MRKTRKILYKKLMKKLDTCSYETLKRMEIINKKEVFPAETANNPIITFDERKIARQELANYEYSLFAKVYIA